MVAVLEAVVDRLGDDFGLVAVDAAGCELLGASVSNIRGAALPCTRHGAKQPLPSGRFRSTSRRSRSSLIDDSRAPAPETPGPLQLTERTVYRTLALTAATEAQAEIDPPRRAAR